jgi:hypothetical protein
MGISPDGVAADVRAAFWKRKRIKNRQFFAVTPAKSLFEGAWPGKGGENP